MTLSQTAILTKQIITISIFALVLGTISFIGYKIWYANYLANLPPVEEKPDTKFGILPAIDFPKSHVSSSNFSYSIDTSTGILPKVGEEAGFEKLVKVYFVTKPLATLLSAEKSQALAEKFDITTPPQILSETTYRFKDNDKLLTIDLDSGNFTFKKEATISAEESLDDDQKLISDFKAILETLGVLKEELKTGPTKVTPLTANTAQISLWPSAVDNKPMITSQFDKSTIYARVYQSAADLKNYSLLNFTYFPTEPSTFATYPIKGSEEAFEDLKNGQGIVIIEPQKPQVSITSIYLGYFLGEFYHPYLQPIFVFEGPNFVAYVPAISEQFQAR